MSQTPEATEASPEGTFNIVSRVGVWGPAQVNVRTVALGIAPAILLEPTPAEERVDLGVLDAEEAAGDNTLTMNVCLSMIDLEGAAVILQHAADTCREVAEQEKAKSGD